MFYFKRMNLCFHVEKIVKKHAMSNNIRNIDAVWDEIVCVPAKTEV